MTRKLAFSAVGLVIFEALALTSAVAKPNFKGTWERKAGRAFPFTAVVAPPIGPRNTVPGKNFIMRVNHVGKRLQVAVEQDGHKPVVINYDLGWRWHGASSPEFGGTRYRTGWEGDTLIIEKHVGYRGEFRSTGVSSKQEWVLSSGGNVLTITTRVGEVTTKEIFFKK